jgi:copper transport protein
MRRLRLAARGLGACLLMVLLLGLLAPTAALAHALLRRSTPPTGQTLTTPPTEVRLLFSEPLDPSFSSVRVLNASGAQVDRGDARVDPADEYQLVVSLPADLPNGVYTVVWRSLSTIDVHPDVGRYPLFVGVPVSTTGGQTAVAQSGSGPETAVARWAFYLTASLFGGVLATWKLLFSGLLVGAYADARPSVLRVCQRAVVVGGVLLVVATLFGALAQAADAASVPPWAAFGRPLADLLGRGRFAAIFWPRIGLEVMALGLVALGGLEGLWADMALAIVPAILLTSSLTSHGAALLSGAYLGIVVDWVHFLAVAAWIGGLATLVFVLPTAVFFITRRICLGLQEKERIEKDREAAEAEASAAPSVAPASAQSLGR